MPPKFGAQLRIGELTGSLATTACGGDLRLVEADFGILLERFSDEVAAGDSSAGLDGGRENGSEQRDAERQPGSAR
jgi:hypothetical protein